MQRERKFVRWQLFNKLIWLIFICTLLITGTGYASQLILALDTEPERLIPIKIKNPQSLPLSMQIYQGMFDLNEHGKVIPYIVENWETTDCLIWTFHVRKFSRRRQMTS